MKGIRKTENADMTIKDVNLFKIKKENEVIDDKIISYIKKCFELEEDCYKPVRVGNFYSNNYIEYESNGDRNKTLSIEEHLEEMKPFFKDIISKKSDT